MTRQTRKSGLSRREFLRMAGVGFGASLIGSGSLLTTPRLARAQASRTGTLRVGWTSPTQVDPALFADAPDISIGVAVYDYLVVTNQKLQILPALAQSWEVSPDGKDYTFKLQSGVKFHDGSDFGAKDVKFTFDRLRDSATKSAAAALYTEVDKIEVVDDLTIKFTLKNPVGPFLGFLADYHACILKEGTKDPANEFNGTGPFKRVNIDFTDRATFEANASYWKAGEPKVEALEMVFTKDTRDLIPALEGGQLDWLSRLPISSFATLKSNSKLTTTSIPTNQFSHVRLRADRGPGQDVKVRQAFRLAMDRALVNKAVLSDLAAIGRDSPIGPLYTEFYTEATPLPARNVEEAKKLLGEAGFADGLNIDFYVPQGEQNSDELAQVLQAQWKEAGINAEIKQVPQSVYYSDAPNNWLDADLAVTVWASRPDPQAYLDLAWHSKQGEELGKWNESHIAIPDLDAAIDAARVEPDVKKRAEQMAIVQKVLIEQGSSYIPYFQPLLTAQSAKVSGIEVAPDPGLTSFSAAAIAP